MIEAELKARVRDPEALRARLARLAVGESSVYHDTYYDWPDRTLTMSGRELRLRLIEAEGRQQGLLTYKEPAVDPASDSKPEHETEVENPPAVDIMLRGLGLAGFVSLQKHCTNYRFVASDREMLATVVRVPELDGTFIEVETITSEQDTVSALDDVRLLLGQLGIQEDDLTSQQYTEAILTARRGKQRELGGHGSK